MHTPTHSIPPPPHTRTYNVIAWRRRQVSFLHLLPPVHGLPTPADSQCHSWTKACNRLSADNWRGTLIFLHTCMYQGSLLACRLYTCTETMLTLLCLTTSRVHNSTLDHMHSCYMFVSLWKLWFLWQLMLIEDCHNQPVASCHRLLSCSSLVTPL